MQIIDCDTKTPLAGVDAALEALLAQKAADDDTPVADWFDHLPKVWRNGYLHVGNLACGYADGRMVPDRERFEETDGELRLLTSEVLPNGERRLRFRAANSPRWYSVTGRGPRENWGCRIRENQRECFIVIDEPAFLRGRMRPEFVAELGSVIATDLMMPFQAAVEDRFGVRTRPAEWQGGHRQSRLWRVHSVRRALRRG